MDRKFFVMKVKISRRDQTIIEQMGEMELVGSPSRDVINGRCMY